MLGVSPDEHGLFFNALRTCLGEGRLGDSVTELGTGIYGDGPSLAGFDCGELFFHAGWPKPGEALPALEIIEAGYPAMRER